MCSGAVLAQIIAGAGSYSEVVRFSSGENYPAIEPKAHISFRLFRPMLAAVMRYGTIYALAAVQACIGAVCSDAVAA